MSSTPPSHHESAPALGHHGPVPPRGSASARGRRAADVVIASVLVVAVAPTMLAVALWLWVHDRGPVLVRRVRRGQDGSPVVSLRFRPAGRLVRSLSLDHLPRLFDVLRGDLTLVGRRATV